MNRQFLPSMLLLAWATNGFAADTNAPATAEPKVPPDLRRMARRIEPDLAGNPDRLPQYINFFSRELGNDSRICAFDVTARAVPENQVELRGFVEFPETRESLVAFLTILGFTVEDRLESLPAMSLGNKVFGQVKASHAYSFDRPSGRRKQENDCLIGEPLLLLREQDGHLLAHSHEGYLGYVASEDVLRVDESGYLNYLTGQRVLVTTTQQVEGQRAIPAGARLKWIETQGDKITVALPDGQTVTLSSTACNVVQTRENEIEEIIDAAKKLLGAPYFWGGRTAEGIDCSGLVQMSYAAAGLHLPRDAYQQFYLGQLTATRWHTAGMRRGDTLYFLGADGKIRHTGIYLGDGKYLQAVMPKARISSFNPKDPDYDADRHVSFAFAKRLLD
jgi:cell wall-associated NlpC family hydrolase